MSDALSLDMLTTPSEAHHSSSASMRMPPFALRAEGHNSHSLPRLMPRMPASGIPRTTPERMLVARDRIRAAAEGGKRVRSYEVALDLDLSEFHFARQFRASFGRSPHVFYDEVRAQKARELLTEGFAEGAVARKIGFRRPAELRALLAKR